MPILNCGVIGTGRLGKFHAEKYAQIEDCNLLAVADIEEKACREVATIHSSLFVTDYRELLGKLDAVSIATPTATHYEIAREFLDHGTHVLLEKPMTLSLEEADELIRIADRRRRLLQIGHIERFNPALLNLDGLLREPMYIESARLMPFKSGTMDSCVIRDLMIHDLDIILYLVASEVTDIKARGAGILSSNTDIANARIEFANGCTANVTASRISRKTERKLRLFQKDHYFSIDFYNNRHTICRHKGNYRIECKEEKFPRSDALRTEIKHFLRCIRENKQPLVGGREGRFALDIALRISAAMAR